MKSWRVEVEIEEWMDALDRLTAGTETAVQWASANGFDYEKDLIDWVWNFDDVAD